jgi:hypothetical protein
MKPIATKWHVFLIIVLVLGTSATLFAQGVTTSAVNGIVTSTTGEALPGANIVAVHNPSGTRYGTATRTDGRFNIPGMRPGGPYTITVSFVGYKQAKQEDITLLLSQNLEVNFSLIEQAVQVGEVTITSERNAIISSARTGAAVSVTRDLIDRVPTVSRSFTDAMRLSPLFVGNSAAGRNNRFNNIQIDGANYNDLFGLGSSGTPGGTSGSTPISLDAIQEFQIVVAPYDVRQGGFTGGGVNAITRSGGNKYTGSVFFYGRNQDFLGSYPDPNGFPRAYTNFTEYQTGFRVGGPIIENKLFFFVNGEIVNRDQPNNRVFGATLASTSTGQWAISPDTVTKFINALNKYGYDPGSFTSFSDQTKNYKIFARLDYNLSEQHRLTLRYNMLSAWNHNSPSQSGAYGENSRYKMVDATNSFAFQVTSAISNTMANELIVGYTPVRDKREFPGSAFPFVLIRSATGTGGQGNLIGGTEEYSVANSLDQDMIEITDNFTYFMTGHTITVGTHNEIYKSDNLYIRDNWGEYEFNTVDDFVRGKPVRYQYSYSQMSDPKWKATLKYMQYGVYAQDEWMVHPRVKLTLGLRLDVPTFPQEPSYNPSVDTLFGSQGLETNKVPSGKLLWSPRLGFNWDILGDRSLQARGGLGIFTGRTAYVWVSNQYSNTGIEIGRLDASFTPATSTFTFQPDPYNQPKPGTQGLAPVRTTEIDLTDKDFKMPQVFRVDLGIDRQLPFGFIGTLEGLYTSSVNDIMYQDINMVGPSDSRISGNALTPGGHLVGDGRPVYGIYSPSTRAWTTVKRSDALSPAVQQFTNVILMKNTNAPYAYQLTLQLQRPFSPDGWYMNFAYTYGKSMDINSTTSSQAMSQWRYDVAIDPNNPELSYSYFDIRHRILAVVSYRFEWLQDFATTISLNYQGTSGWPFSWVYNGDVNGDGQTSNDPAYIPNDRNDVILMSGTGATATALPYTDATYDRLNQYINSDVYLSTHRGQIAERYGARTPWNHQVDLRLAQEVAVIEGHKLEVTLDILNFLNVIGGGRIKSVAYQVNLLAFHSLDPTTGKPRFVWQVTDPSIPPWYNSDPASRWQAQLGLRYSF